MKIIKTLPGARYDVEVRERSAGWYDVRYISKRTGWFAFARGRDGFPYTTESEAAAIAKARRVFAGLDQRFFKETPA